MFMHDMQTGFFCIRLLAYALGSLPRKTVFSKKTRSKKLTVKGGFYSREDMKTELGYSQYFNLNLMQTFFRYMTFT